MASQPLLEDDWESTTKSSLVSIGTHSLFLSVSGPPRHGNSPLVIIFSGAGDTISSYVAVSRLLTPFARLLLYDRSGLGRSEDGPNRSTAVVAAEELSTLLKVTGISPPYILVAHSYGATVAREFLHFHDNAVAGMVFADGSTEWVCQYFRIPDPNIIAVMGDLNFAQVTGLRADSKLSREEWRARAAERPRCMAASMAEAAAFVEVCETLGEKRQCEKRVMGERPVSVVRGNWARDYWRIYEKGVEMGNGTAEERKGFKELLDGWDGIDEEMQREQLKLSSRSRYVHVPDCGHNIQLVRPDVIVKEVRWVLENLVR